MTAKFTRTVLSTAIAASFVVEAVPVLAQGILEEVVVTARKREESILKVPVTVSVLSRESLDQYAIGDVKGIADKTPGLNFNTGPVSSGVLVSLRGIGTGTNNPTIDQSVALVSDGVQFTQGLAFQASSFDMAQVEVLKGPQALFFGKAAPAGVISIRTADPMEEAEISFRAGYEYEAEEVLGELIVSGPVTDTLGLRLAAQFSDMDGYLENVAVPADHPFVGSLGAAPVKYDSYPNQESLLLRGTAVWEPTDRLKARLKLNYGDVDSQGSGGELQYASCPEGTDSTFTNLVFGGPFAGVNFIGGTDCDFDDKIVSSYMDPAAYPNIYNGGVPYSESEQYFGSLELTYDFDDLSLTSVTGYYQVEQESLVNGGATTIFGTPFALQGILERDDITQEFRLTSSYGGPLNFMIGAFYQDGQMDYLSTLPFNQTFSIFGRPAPPSAAWADHRIDIEAISVFGQVLWNISPELELGVGVRYTDEERSHNVMDLTAQVFFDGSAVAVPVAKPDIDSQNWSPEVSLTYTPTDELTVYANLKQAYKSGSFDSGGAVTPGEDTSFDDERVRGGEVGIKSLQQGGNLVLNAAAYYYEFTDLQVEANEFDIAAGRVGVRTTNAASAEIYGIDFDMAYAPPEVEGLTFYGAINWNKGEYKEFDNALCWTGQIQSQGCNVDFDGNGVGDAQDLSGEPLLRAPEWTGNFGFDYERPLANDLTLRVGSNINYSDDYSTGIENRSDMFQNDYTKVSATLGLIGSDERWKVEVIGDNLTDEIVTGKCTVRGFADSLLFGGDAFNGTGTVAGGPGGQGEVACHTERGRAVWMRFTYNFL